MPRPDPKPQIRGVIARADPVVTVSDIAEELDVTKSAVQKQIDEVVEENPEIQTRTVGRTRVFWEDLGEAVKDFKLEPEDFWDYERERVAKDRAMWRTRLEEARRYEAADSTERERVEARAALWDAVRQMQPDRVKIDRESRPSSKGSDGGAGTPPTVDEVESVEYNLEVSVPPSSALSEEQVRRYYQEEVQFRAGWFGEVTLFDLPAYDHAKRAYICEEHGEWSPNLDEVDSEVLDTVYPTVSEIAAVGESLDWLLGELYNTRW